MGIPYVFQYASFLQKMIILQNTRMIFEELIKEYESSLDELRAELPRDEMIEEYVNTVRGLKVELAGCLMAIEALEKTRRKPGVSK